MPAFDGDCCFGFFEDAWNAGRLPLKPGADVLEIGSGESDWLGAMRAIRPDLELVGIDWRPATDAAALRADVLTTDFAPDRFDGIVSISTLEHIGLGAYDHDPIDPDGDTKAIRRAWRWLRPGGWLYFDVPYRPTGPYFVTDNFRAYDPAAFDARFDVGARVELWRAIYDAPLGGDAPYIAVVWQKPESH